MRLEGNTTLVLSKRNLLSLLAKLDGYPANSACTLLGGDEAPGFRVVAESDEIHYSSRPAGPIHAYTYKHITESTMLAEMDRREGRAS